MKHIKPFPFPDASEHLADRRALLDKILAGVFVQSTLPDGRTYPPFTPDWVHSNDWRDYPCWLFAGKWHDSRGYKKVKYKRHTLYVHRVTYELMVGPVPDGHILDHLCKTRGCCQPRHLEPITQRKNIERGDNQNYLYRQSLCAIAGVIGDRAVVVDTHRPEHWTTPAMMQAHIDHAHPRFRTPLGALEPPKPFDIVTTNGKPARAVRVTDIPPDHLVIGRSAVAADAIQNGPVLHFGHTASDIARNIIENNPPDTVQLLPDGSLYIPYTEEEQEALLRASLVPIDWWDEPVRLPRFIQRFLAWWRS